MVFPMKNKCFSILCRLGMIALLLSFFLTACQKQQEKPWQYFGDNTAETQAAAHPQHARAATP